MNGKRKRIFDKDCRYVEDYRIYVGFNNMSLRTRKKKMNRSY